MPDASLAQPKDPNLPLYRYAADRLVPVYGRRRGGKRIATVLLGEWMKIAEADGHLPQSGRVRVAFRGGTGYVAPNHLSPLRHLEIFFIDVDQGDSILIQTPDDRRILIDGGQTDDAHGFIITKYGLDKPDHYVDFEAVVATHSDMDHTGGLINILRDPRIAVKRVYHNGLWRRTKSAGDPGPHPSGRVRGLADEPALNASPPLKYLMKRFLKAVRKARENLPRVVAKMKDIPRWKGRIDTDLGPMPCKRLDAADRFLPPYDDHNPYVTMEVLWPKADGSGSGASYPWYGDAGKTVNGNSIVLRLAHGRNVVLLTGDLNTASMDDVLREYKRRRRNGRPMLRTHVYKAAHHGSQHFSLDFLKALRPEAAVISSGDNAKDRHGHPRAVLLGTITRYSSRAKPAVFSTELARCYAKLSDRQRRDVQEYRGGLYEKAIEGIVHLRSNGRKMFLGTVHGRKGGPHRQALWKWDVWPEE